MRWGWGKREPVMKFNWAFTLVLFALCTGQLKAQKSIFDDPNAKEEPSPSVQPRPAPPVRTAPKARPTTRPADEVVEELNAKILQLQRENADLQARVKELSAALTAIDSKKLALDKAKEDAKKEHDQRVAAAKARKELENLARIKAGVSLSYAEQLAGNKVKINSSSVVHQAPRVGYFGPLDHRRDECTLPFTKGDQTLEISLVAMDGIITEVNVH